MRDDHATVARLGRQQRDVAAQRCRDVAVIDHAAGGAVAREAIAARHEVGSGDAVRGGHQAADIDAGARCEVDAVGVTQKNLARCCDLAEDLARVGVEHAVQGHAAGTRLVEVDLRLGTNIEGAPVNGGAAAALVDVERGGALADAGAAGNDLTTGWQLRGCWWAGDGRRHAYAQRSAQGD